MICFCFKTINKKNKKIKKSGSSPLLNTTGYQIVPSFWFFTFSEIGKVFLVAPLYFLTVCRVHLSSLSPYLRDMLKLGKKVSSPLPGTFPKCLFANTHLRSTNSIPQNVVWLCAIVVALRIVVSTIWDQFPHRHFKKSQWSGFLAMNPSTNLVSSFS